MSYARRYPPQNGRKGHLHSMHSGDLPEGGPELAALLWSNGITAVADLREAADPNLKENVEQYGVAYGHVPSEDRDTRLRRAEQLYHTLAVTGDGSPEITTSPVLPLPCAHEPNARKA